MSDFPDNLSLREAVHWCKVELVEAVRRAEAYFTETDIWHKGWTCLGGARGLRVRSCDGYAEGMARSRVLAKAWDDLLNDFRRRVQVSEIFLSGVRTRPTLQSCITPIPNVWAQGFEFDFRKDAVTFEGTFEYIGVIASKNPPAEPPDTSTNLDPGTQTITPETVYVLEDDVILALLEEHAKRVVENDGPLITPGKISVMPIIRRKMEWRSQRRELCGTLAAEAECLADWIAKKIPSHQVPAAAAIKNALRKVYRGLKA